VAYLIDGNNFIGHTSPYEIKNIRSKYELVYRLLIFQLIKKTKIFLVFDGPPDSLLSTKEFKEKPFQIIFPPIEKNADMIIKDIILKQKDLKKFLVVSMDREIKNFARSKGAKVLSCEDFNTQLKETMKKHKKFLEKQKNVTTSSPLEVKHWIEIFKAKNE